MANVRILAKNCYNWRPRQQNMEKKSKKKSNFTAPIYFQRQNICTSPVGCVGEAPMPWFAPMALLPGGR